MTEFKFKRLLCWLGKHKWRLTYNSFVSLNGVYKQYVCVRCRKRKWQQR